MANPLFLFLSDYLVTAYPWDKGGCGAGVHFENSTEGQEAFRSYWQQHLPAGAVYLLVDVIEEDLHNEITPKLVGSNRKKMLAGRGRRMFRHTPFFYGHVQGKMADDKLKEQVLFLGLTEPDKLLEWLTLLQEQRAQLAGIVSLPLLCQELFKKNLLEHSDALVIVPNQGRLRQVFLRDGRMLVSRLSNFQGQAAEDVQMFIHGEVARMQGYLASLRLVNHNATLEVYVLCAGELHDLLSSGKNAVSSYHCHPLNAEAVATRLGVTTELRHTDHLEPFFCGFLLKQRNRNHYARTEDSRLYRTLRLRTLLRFLNLAFLLLGVGTGLVLFLDGFATYSRLPELSRKADAAQVALQQVGGSDQDVAAGIDLVGVVRTVDTLRRFATTPQPMLLTISQVLTQHGDIWLAGLEWFAGPPPPDPKEGTAKKGGRPDKAPPKQNVPNKPGLQHARLRGELRPFTGNTEQAREKIQAFMEALRALPAVLAVSALSMPVDPSQTAVLERGNMAASAKQAEFLLLVILQGEESP
ncbi:MAG: hypothetical protein HQL88_08215 [Magnetococcales bacterium]|nr:hypothetical protein [Magnetococcales bacterium]